MESPAFKVRLRLLASNEGGRDSAIRSDYRPTFDLGTTPRGKPMLCGGRILLVGEQLAPGAEGVATIEPLRTEYWDLVRSGNVIPVMEGTRTVGHATVVECMWPDALTSDVASFVRAAYDLCTFVEASERSALGERLSLARDVLLALYAAGSQLPEIERTRARDAPAASAPANWSGFDAFDTYWEVFDPYDLDEPVAASLSDDILDVYGDVRRGIWFWEKNEIRDAVWEWRFSFESHWGDHAIDALRALHRACGRASVVTKVEGTAST